MSKSKKFNPDTPITQSHDTGSPRLPDGAHTNADEIEQMFDVVLAEVDNRSDFGEMLSDLYDWWQEKGFLTERQYETLERTYERS